MILNKPVRHDGDPRHHCAIVHLDRSSHVGAPDWIFITLMNPGPEFSVRLLSVIITPILRDSASPVPQLRLCARKTCQVLGTFGPLRHRVGRPSTRSLTQGAMHPAIRVFLTRPKPARLSRGRQRLFGSTPCSLMRNVSGRFIFHTPRRSRHGCLLAMHNLPNNLVTSGAA